MDEPTITAGTGLGDVTNSIAGLSIANHPEVYNRSRLSQSTLTKAINNLNHVATATCLQGQEVLASASDAHIASSGAVAEICWLRRRANELANAANALSDATERSIIERVSLFGGQRDPSTKELLTHFNERIRVIVRDVLNSSTDGACVLWNRGRVL
ncbi:hypothetical protein BHE90_012486 [Fusarium euwallaceae]|uniref:Uncharacterized protein n=1 Tax=Fusarium euwallaceae TaxID=1147111 RepID=A0A430LBJ4_9HYPO|nr:hypothetical protein BHE90_012486 [Fusarium euwallaceae]